VLHIIGLEETKDSPIKKIERKKVKDRNEGSLIENTITVLKRKKYFGYNTDDETEQKYFELALELNITWLNRILFLKLLEGQLIKYNANPKFAFLNKERIKDFDDLDELFFEVLAVPNSERENSVAKLFNDIPYLNSSLFELTDLEKAHQGINQLKDRLSMPIYDSTVFKDGKGKRISGEMATMQYLFKFLDAYDFASESSAKIQKENKTVINASVLGLIFEKINGYKDGSFFTPGFITMYMCKETIHKVVIEKFNEVNKWKCKTIEEVKEKIDHTDKEQRIKANEIINSIKVCDPAVGSGHFLVSALNALIEVKSFLKVLSYRDNNRTRVKGFKIEIVNDELIITNEETDKLFEYKLNQNGKPITELQDLQETLFHEKQDLIENSLFGVDINPKSVMICRLRLWIELLKNAYYTQGSEYKHLETLPNIDINIKWGNSLISRFAIDDKNSMLPKDREFVKQLIEKYKILVDGYKNALDKKAKDDYRRQIGYIKTEVEKFTFPNDKDYAQLKKKEGELMQTVMVFDPKEKERLNKLAEEVTELKKAYEEKLKTVYGNSFEWRFEFPEVLDKDGQFQGFDLVIGNPPYLSYYSR
jgi:adenine-specific DNA-methyltransferase